MYKKKQGRAMMRKVIDLNKGWTFTKDGESVKVDVPHTWNAVDGQDGGNDYCRTTCTYTKTFTRPAYGEDERVYLEFRGVNSQSVVNVNGKEAVRHNGGYSTFRADVTDLLLDENVLEVIVSNEATEEVYPQTADFTFYGGIYRDVYLIVVNKNRFDLDYYGGSGIKVDAEVNSGKGILKVTPYISGEGEVKLTLYDADGKAVASGESPLEVENVHLWHGVDDPYLYSLDAELNVGGKVTDKVSCNVGFRTFSVDPKKGFILNGKPYPLRGVCRHQDRLGLGNALTKKEHDEDAALIKEVGATTIRLAHYQHDQYFYDLCDKYGFVIWAEIPYISRHMEEANDNALEQMKELIVQNYNHPSIVTWGISNEITMKKCNGDRNAFHKKLNAFCKELDPTRPTVIANFVMCSIWNKISHITDMASFNLYYGWYAPFTFMTGVVLDWFHFFYGKTPVGLSEYGAECMPTLHSAHPKRGDSTEEYHVIYHERILKIIEKRPWIWGTHVWNMFDFASDGRNHGGDPGKNHKGLVTFDRKIKKDAFYLYKAHWSKDPFIHISGKRYANRAEKVTTVRVFCNAGDVRLTNNGKEIKCKKTDGKDFIFKVRLDKVNELVATCGELKDSCTLCKVDVPDENYRLHTKSNNHSWEKKSK